MSKYPATNIVYSGIEDKGGPTVTILDEKKHKWTIWKKDYDNPDRYSEAYSSLQNFHIGESFGVEYGEKEESFTPTEGPNRGKSIKFTRRTIFKILPTVANPTAIPSQTPAPAQSSNPGHSVASGGALKDDTFWERQAYEKCCSLWIASMIREGSTAQVTIKNAIKTGYFWDLFQAIKADGANRFVATPNSVANLEPELPVIQVEETISDLGDDIPFV